MPQYKVIKRTLFSHLGRVYEPGEVVSIDWGVDAKGKSAAPSKLGENLELVVADGDEEKTSRRRGASDA